MKLKSFALLLLAGACIGTASAQEHLKSLDKAGIDNSIAPGQDFFRHVNSTWMKTHPLTPEYSRYGQFNILTDSSSNRVSRIVRNLAASNPAPGTDAYKIANLYALAMDSTRRNALGATPIKPALTRIENAKPEQMTDLLLWVSDNYGDPFFGLGHMEDLGNSTQYAMYLSPAGLGLGDRDYYLSNDKRNAEVRRAYQALITKMMQLSGYSKKDARRIAANVLKIETLMADSARTREESRDVAAQYNPRTLVQLEQAYPNLPMRRVFTENMKIEAPANVILTDPRAVAQSNALMGSLSDREKKDYYLYTVVASMAPYLSDAFGDAMFEFDKVMSGVESQQPRWKRALGVTESFMGEGIGRLYVEEYFPASSKAYMLELVENLRTALGKHIIDLTWMTTDTKLKALNKLNSFAVKIGYPDKWKDYSALTIDPALSYAENITNARKWRQAEYMAKWGKPVDRSEWGMTPQAINAYYNPVANEICFPAGILQAPFFDENSSDAENYGGIGVVIGHEMTHGFDDQGRNFDANGNMTNWWLPADAEAFANLTKVLADQYSAEEVLPGLKANGVYTLGENIADQGGLRIAMTAFLDAQKKKGVDVKSAEALIDGFTPEQVFYMNYANLWAQNLREAEIRSRTVSDVHSLGELRVNTAVRNLQPFFDAFAIKKGDKMFRPVEERVIIW